MRKKQPARPLSGKQKKLSDERILFINSLWYEGPCRREDFRRVVGHSQTVIDRHLFQTRQEFLEFKLKQKESL